MGTHGIRRPRLTRRGLLATTVGVLAGAGTAAGLLVATGGSAGAAGGTNYSDLAKGTGYHTCLDPKTLVPTAWNGKAYTQFWPNDAQHPIFCVNGRVPAVFGGPASPAPAPTTTAIDSDATTLDHVGGSWSTGHTALGTQDLVAGTYVVTVNGDFYRAGTQGACTDLTATPVLQIQVNGLAHQVTAYTGAFPASPSETCGVGSDGTPNGLEQTASASATVVVPAGGGTAELDAFGYNPDRGSEGSGSFGVIGHAQFTKIG